MKLTFEKASEIIQNKFEYLKLIKLGNKNKKSLFIDIIFGEFNGNFRDVSAGNIKHIDRIIFDIKNKNIKRISLPRIYTLDDANYIMNKIHNHLKVIEFKCCSKVAKFIDLEYGEFEGNYSEVMRARKHHPKRSEINVKNGNIKAKQTNIEKYGFETPTKNNFIKEKIKKTNYIKYGGPSPTCDKQIRDKCKQTLIKNYGVEIPFKSLEILEKHIFNNIKKYGVKCVFENEIIKNKIHQTFLKKYGVTTPFESEEIQNRIKESVKNKYNVDNVNKLDLIKLIKKQSLIKCGQYKNVNGLTAYEYYINNNINGSYESFLNYFNKFGIEKINDYIKFKNIDNGSKIANLWLNDIEKQINRKLIREFKIPNTYYIADGFDATTNTIYEFYGDYWHGYPFKNLGINNTLNLSFNTLYYKTICREENIIKLNYQIVSIWESDYLKLIN